MIVHDKLIAAWFFVRSHLTKTVGMIGMGFGYAQDNFDNIKYLIPTQYRGRIMIGFGLVVFAIGLWNTLNPPVKP